jgi:diguanylate cyclase (GGDEF)-like protein
MNEAGGESTPATGAEGEQGAGPDGRPRELSLSERRAIAEGSRVARAEVEAKVDLLSLRYYVDNSIWSSAAMALAVSLVMLVLWPHGRHGALLLWGSAVVLCAIAHGAALRSLRRELATSESLPRVQRVNASLWLAGAVLGAGLTVFLEGIGLEDAVLALAVVAALNVFALSWLAAVASPFIGLCVLSLAPPGGWLLLQGLESGQGTLATLGAGTLAMLGLALVSHGLLHRQIQRMMWFGVERREWSARLERYNRELYADKAHLETESRTDPLTGLSNRRYLEELLDREWNRCRREGQPLACVLLDIDHFKRFNDHYGHDGGDRCLRQVGQVLKNGLKRASDHAARYGGEEFMVLLPNTDLDGAVRVAEQLRQAVAARCIPHAASETADHLTVSLGAASMVPDEDTLVQELPKAADLALYEAKHQGRDRCVAADQSMRVSARMAARGLIG